MDETDLQILQELSKNPQTPFSQIAEKTGVSPRTVQKKYEKMKSKGIILRSSIIVDLSKLGYQGRANLKITNLPSQPKATTINALKKIPNIFIITEIIGDFDILALAAVRDYASIINMVNTVWKLPSVEKIETDFLTDTQFPMTKGFSRQLAIEKNKH